MALIVPSRHSTFGDATTSMQGGLKRQYVLATFRSDADLDWLRQLRTALGNDEVKHQAFVDRKASIRAIPELWAKLERGVARATIFITDPSPILETVRGDLGALGAIEGKDFDSTFLVKRCIEILIGSTAVARLSEDLLRFLQPAGYRSLRNPSAFDPETLATRLRNRLRDASLFTARAHAMFDL